MYTVWEGCLLSHVTILVTDAELASEIVLCLNGYTFTTSKHISDLVNGEYISKYFQWQSVINILQLSCMQASSSNARCLWDIRLAIHGANSTKISVAFLEQIQSHKIHCVLTVNIVYNQILHMNISTNQATKTHSGILFSVYFFFILEPHGGRETLWPSCVQQTYTVGTEMQKGSRFGRKKIQGGSNMTGTDLCVNKPHCAAAVRSWESEATTSTLPTAQVRTCSVLSGSC